jgi:hypothetical protein
MDALNPIHHNEGCDIGEGEIAQDLRYLRGVVGPGLAVDVQECYRHFIHECLQRGCTRALIIGKSKWDPFYHLALRDALRSMSVAGLPAGFRLALIADSADLIAVYDAAMVEAQRLGIEARRFRNEVDALAWLSGAPP